MVYYFLLYSLNTAVRAARLVILKKKYQFFFHEILTKTNRCCVCQLGINIWLDSPD